MLGAYGVWDATVSRAIVRGFNAYRGRREYSRHRVRHGANAAALDRLAAHDSRRSTYHLAVRTGSEVPEFRGSEVEFRIILFDGTCAFCERSVRFIASRDSGYFKFGASQNPAGRALLARFGTRSRSGTQHHPDRRRSSLSAFGQRCCASPATCRAPWKYARVFLGVPRRFVRDAVYRHRRGDSPSHRRQVECL